MMIFFCTIWLKDRQNMSVTYQLKKFEIWANLRGIVFWSKNAPCIDNMMTSDAIPMAAATCGHIMPGFTSSLVSLGHLCNANCNAFLNKQAITVYDDTDSPILHGKCDIAGAPLWRFDLLHPHPPPNHPQHPAFTHSTHTTHNTAAAAATPYSTTEAAKHSYDPPSTKAPVEYLHATAR